MERLSEAISTEASISVVGFQGKSEFQLLGWHGDGDMIVVSGFGQCQAKAMGTIRLEDDALMLEWANVMEDRRQRIVFTQPLSSVGWLFETEREGQTMSGELWTSRHVTRYLHLGV